MKIKTLLAGLIGLALSLPNSMQAQNGVFNLLSADSLSANWIGTADTVNLDYLSDTTASHIAPIGVSPSGNIQFLDPLSVPSFQVSTAADILTLSAPVNSIIFTAVGGRYIVKADSTLPLAYGGGNYPVDSCVIVPTSNGHYAFLQVRDGGFYIEDFGAQSDNYDDSDAIQKCIDAAISLYNTSRVNAGPGRFYLDSGVVISRRNGNEFESVTLTLSGNIPVYDDNPSIGSVTTFHLRDSTFAVAVQEGRNVLIENIAFIGNADYQSITTSPGLLITSDTLDWGVSRRARINNYSPSCAIAIDPFHSALPSNLRYPGHGDEYTNLGKGGTSMLTIKGCEFRYHYIAISNNSSDVVQNGDNIRAENCRVANCHTFWAVGQDQSRSNSIDNIYSQYVNRFVDCDYIGSGYGTPPAITNCNLAGYTKEFIHMVDPGRSPVRVSNCYMESIFSLGYMAANSVSFHQCQIKFMLPTDGDGLYQAPYHFSTTGVASFSDCDIEFYTAGSMQMPFRFGSRALNFSGGSIRGGVLTNGAPSGAQIHQVNYEHAYQVSLSAILGKRNSGENYWTLGKRYMLGGDEIQAPYDGTQIFKNEGTTYNINYRGLYYLNLDAANERVYFIVSDPALYKLEDNLIGEPYHTGGQPAYTDPSDIHMSGYGGALGSLGFVSEISGDTIFVSGTPYGFHEGNAYVHHIEYPIFFAPLWGDLTNGNDTIKSVQILTGNLLTTTNFLGHRIYGDGIPTGAYITAVNKDDRYFVMSSAATKTKNFEYLYNAKYTQTVLRSDTIWPPTRLNAYIEGAKIYFEKVPSSNYGFVVTKGGFSASSILPLYGAMTY